MILTDKCTVDFKKWLNDNYNSETIFSTATGDYEGGYFENDHTIHDLALYYEKVPYLLNSLIIEFFDSVGFFIEITKSVDSFWFYYIKINNQKIYISVLDPMQKTRQEATEKAIEHANKIYNATKV